MFVFPFFKKKNVMSFFEFRFNFEFVIAFIVIGDFSDKFEIRFACQNFSLFKFFH